MIVSGHFSNGVTIQNFETEKMCHFAENSINEMCSNPTIHNANEKWNRWEEFRCNVKTKCVKLPTSDVTLKIKKA